MSVELTSECAGASYGRVQLYGNVMGSILMVGELCIFHVILLGTKDDYEARDFHTGTDPVFDFLVARFKVNRCTARCSVSF